MNCVDEECVVALPTQAFIEPLGRQIAAAGLQFQPAGTTPACFVCRCDHQGAGQALAARLFRNVQVIKNETALCTYGIEQWVQLGKADDSVVFGFDYKHQ